MDDADLTDIADGRNIAVMTIQQRIVQAVVSAAFIVGAADMPHYGHYLAKF